MRSGIEFFDKIYLINLDSRPDRLEQATRELNSIGITDFIRIPGVVDPNPARGCHLAHAKIFALADNYVTGRILIFEDDVEFFPNALETLTKAMHELEPNPMSGDWDMLYLGINMDQYYAHQVLPHVAYLTGGFSTHAYAVNNQRGLFHKLWEINYDPNTVHNDVVYTNEIMPNYKCYVTIPLAAGQRDSYSDVQGKVMSSNQMFLERFQGRLIRNGS